MKKLMISNLCTFIMTVSVGYVVYSTILEDQTQKLTSQYKVKSIKQNVVDRKPSSIPVEAVRIAEARAEMARLKHHIQYDPDNWNDQFLMRYQGTKDVNGELVSISDLYRPYFTELHKLLKKYHGKNASKRLAQLIRAKEKHDEQLEQFDNESMVAEEIEYEKQHLLIEKKAKEMRAELEESEDYTKDEIERLVGRFKDMQHSVAENTYQMKNNEKYLKVSQLYEFEKKKILGAAYLESERLKEHYNEQYHKAYGNRFYKVSGEWDEQSKEYVQYDEPVERESEQAVFVIRL